MKSCNINFTVDIPSSWDVDEVDGFNIKTWTTG